MPVVQVHAEVLRFPIIHVRRRGPPVSDLPPTVFVLFGATGDLARRKLLPGRRN